MVLTDDERTTSQDTDPARTFMAGQVSESLGLTGDDLQIGLRIAKGHMERGALAEALRIYAALVVCAPKTVDFQVGLAHCAVRMEAFDLALQAASVVVALAPRDPRGYYLSGQSCIGLGLTTEAREDLGDAVKFGIEALAAPLVESARALMNALPSATSPRDDASVP